MQRFNAAEISLIEIGNEQNPLSAAARREGKEISGGGALPPTARNLFYTHKAQERKEGTKLPIRI